MIKPSTERNQPLLSIVTVSAFDIERLAETLDSLNQISPILEFILVLPRNDSASLSFANKKLKNSNHPFKLILDDNLGIYEAMNLGLEASSGRYCLFLNSGDLIQPGINLDVVQKVFTGSSAEWIIFVPKLGWKNSHLTNEKEIRDFFTMKSDVFLSHQAVCFLTDTARQLGGYNTTYKVVADTHLMLKFWLSNLPLISSESIAIVEVPNFASRNQRRARLEFLLLVIQEYPLAMKLLTLYRIVLREIRVKF